MLRMTEKACSQILSDSSQQHAGYLHTLKVTEKACSQVQWSMTEEISRWTVMMTAVKRVAPVCHWPAVRPL